MTPLGIPGPHGGEVPHWAAMDAGVWRAFEEFETFLEIVWSHLVLPQPTRAQRLIAARLQVLSDAGGAEEIIRAFRGVGKSYITAAFVLWRLMRNPRDELVLVVSATGGKAFEFVSMVKSLLRTMPMLEFLVPEEGQRNRADRFDVRGKSISQSYSLKAAGITGQITGGRATLIVGDDIEIPANSKTEEARKTLFALAAEFEAIKLPGADVLFLGTPQTEESIYNRLVIERGYGCYTIPARYPTAEKLPNYELKRDTGEIINILAPELAAWAAEGRIGPTEPTDPERFGEADLIKRESKGRAWFALQYQLDTSLSDAERYPLRSRDLVVMALNHAMAPRMVQWGRDSDGANVIRDIPNLGFTGDHFLRPLFLDKDWRPYEAKGVLWVDPSGRGTDETAWAVVKPNNGLLYAVHVGGHRGASAEAMHMIAVAAKTYDVSEIVVEPNYAGEIWITAFQPILAKVWPGGCSVIEGEWSKGQKEHRIIDTLEPVLTNHRLVLDEAVIRADVKNEDRDYSLVYQLTHITRDRGALVHEDRLEALAAAVNYLHRSLGQDVDEVSAAADQAERDAYIERRLERANGGTLATRAGNRSRGRVDEVMQVDASGHGVIFLGGDDPDDEDDRAPWRPNAGRGGRWATGGSRWRH